MSKTQNLIEKGTLFLPESISKYSNGFDTLFYVIFWTSMIFFFGLLILGFIFVISGKRQHPNQKAKKQIIHNVKLEIVWTIIPTFIVLIIFVWGFKEFVSMRTTPTNAVNIYVSGKKWFWEFTYENGKKTVDELVVPVGKPVKLIMSSTDVLHSFYIPNLRIKRDVIPNRHTILWFQIDKEGVYNVFCTEYCGDQHSNMRAIIDAKSVDDFIVFLNDSGELDPSIPLNEHGEKLYASKGCQACHSIDGKNEGWVGPTWKNLYGANRKFTDGTSAIADEVYLSESILYPNRKIVEGYPGVMPSYLGLLSDQEIEAIIEYIKELSE